MSKQLQCLFILLGFYINSFAQNVPIGQWQSYYPYNSATAIEVAGTSIFAGKYGLLQYNVATNEYTSFSKVNGLSDVNITNLAWDAATQSLLICYQNSNIDILQNNRIFNIPDLKNANIVASKKINNVRVIDNNFYLATGIGILIIDPKRQEVKDTYPMIVNAQQASVFDVQIYNQQLLALTNKGIYTANVNNNLLKDINNWQLVNAGIFNKICVANQKLFLLKPDVLFTWDGGANAVPVYNANLTMYDIVFAKNNLHITTFDGFGTIVQLDTFGNALDTLSGQSAQNITADVAGNVWAANAFSGITKIENNKGAYNYSINGPYSIDGFNMKVINNNLYLIGGGIDGLPFYNAIGNRSGFSVLSNNEWTTFNQFNGIPAMDTMLNILDVEVDAKTNSIYAGSYGGGLLEIKKDKSHVVKKSDNEITAGIGMANANLVTNMHNDDDKNLWITVSNTLKNLVVKKNDGTWQTFEIPTSGEFKVLSDFVIDNSNQLWILLPRSRGLLVYNYNNTIDNKTDDKYMIYLAGEGSGNLVSNQVLSIAKDKDGKIFIGTDNGVSIINCPESAFAPGGCQAERKVVNFGVADNYLFVGESVTSIAIDGANRKWFGSTNGVWLMNAESDSIRLRFSADNSPLPSNEIQKIAINPTTGLVYFSTASGLVSYRGTATDGALEIEEPIVFPNPIQANYTGTIAIKGLYQDADVRITDASGKLVYRTKALGGQAIWNGLTYTGYRPNSGVYYVFATNADGSKTQQTKFIFMQ